MNNEFLFLVGCLNLGLFDFGDSLAPKHFLFQGLLPHLFQAEVGFIRELPQHIAMEFLFIFLLERTEHSYSLSGTLLLTGATMGLALPSTTLDKQLNIII
jgi:hypothetical protein